MAKFMGNLMQLVTWFSFVLHQSLGDKHEIYFVCGEDHLR